MPDPSPPRPAPAAATETLSVVPSAGFVVTLGAARGDGLGIADDLVLDDIYQLSPEAPRLPLAAMVAPDGRMAVAAGSATGRAGNALHLDCCLTLAEPDGHLIEMLVLVEVEGGAVAEIYGLPLGPLEPKRDYRLVGLDRHAATARLAQAASASFARGTRITMASGAQVPVEALRAGDRVLTRDDGAQPIRWIGHRTVRATGAFAPVVIRQGALNNAHDLVLAPDHRIFVWQRQDRLGAGRAEVLVKVRHLVNGDTVQIREGGHVDYFQLVFDDHQIVYAEGIAAESVVVDPRTRAALPAGAVPHAPRPHLLYEVAETLLPGAEAVELLRRASGAR
jgi:hypothetical protein